MMCGPRAYSAEGGACIKARPLFNMPSFTLFSTALSRLRRHAADAQAFFFSVFFILGQVLLLAKPLLP